ncbi:MAG: GGDEF domain-containing protein [Gammaproteobacteria bacterium]|nr:GGDEF domain-containing protein [Gammaproteobacteria bacterium]
MPTLEGIEVVELWEVDLEFVVEEMFREAESGIPEFTHTEPAQSEQLGTIELFRDLDINDLTATAASSQSIHAVPGHVLLSPGRLNTKVFFVLEGQLRLYAPTGDKRPVAIVDIGHTTGLRSALAMQPTEHAVIATELSHVISVEIAVLDELSKRLHPFACKYTSLLASYVRNDHCLYVGARAPGGAARPGYIDELTLLHNQHWLNTMFPRLVNRYQRGDKPLSVAAFAVDKLDHIVKEHGIGTGLRVLQSIGHWVLDQTRPTDLLAIDKNRFIYVFLPDCDLEAARQLANRLSRLVQAVPISLASAKSQKPITITFSLGATVLTKEMKDHEFLHNAEALVRKSLKLGGNQLSEVV